MVVGELVVAGPCIAPAIAGATIMLPGGMVPISQKFVMIVVGWVFFFGNAPL